MSDYDLIIRGGTIIDGSGASAYRADIAVREGLIAEIGQISGSAASVIDATGAIVTPGFVDIHTHYDGLATWTDRMNPSSHHGVTTVVMGNCGVGFAPVRPADHELLVELMEGVEDIPGTALHEGLPWAWETFPEYLDFLDQRQYDMDIAAQLPHAALRVYVMGQRGADREEATEADIAEMRRLTAEAMKAGALGFTSSRTLNHKSIKGDPTPSLTAAEAELVGIAQGVADAGTGVLEMISDFKGLDQEFQILMHMVDAAKAPMTISLAQGLNANGWKKILNKIDEANANGREVKGQVAPRAIGVLFGLTASNTPFSGCQTYRDISKLPLADKVRALSEPEFRQRLLAEYHDRPNTVNLNNFWALTEDWDYEPERSQSIGAMAAQQAKDPAELALDIMLQNNGEQLLYMPFANYTDGNLDCCRDMILAENTVMGLGDGGAHVGAICDASFITYLLTHWGRDRKRGDKIPLETLIKAQTSDTASAVRLHDRGLLKPGLRADINVIDFDNLRLALPSMVHDLPSGAGRLEQKTTGYLATIVNGTVTYRNGEATGELPGRLIRGAREATMQA
ncbi:MAG: amidohydrolase family protein [Pseudomonadales bacterium]|nr:amidohydrolase family protein [Pseudomonadales bacterium]